jgi:hypothetical protein
MRRSILAALAAVLVSTVAAPPAQAAPVVSVIVVDSDETPRETSFATVPGEPYMITVTGAFLRYEDDFVPWFADCGWRFSGAPSDAVTVDGHAAGCQSMPYSEQHTYQWTETGTGRPFRFEIARALFAGGLTFTVTGARAQHSVAAFCAPRVAYPPLGYATVAVETGATASEPESAVSTYAVCDVTSASGASAHLELGLPGPAVETAAQLTVPRGDRLTVCSYGGALWDDVVEVTSTRVCYVVTV